MACPAVRSAMSAWLASSVNRVAAALLVLREGADRPFDSPHLSKLIGPSAKRLLVRRLWVRGRAGPDRWRRRGPVAAHP